MIHSYNEWDSIKEIVVGRADFANWPSNDPVFSKESEKTTWTETPVPSGPVPDWIIDEANEDLDTLAMMLEKYGATVHRPKAINFQERGGMYNYCPRDRLLIHGNTIVDPAMMYPCRDMETEALEDIIYRADTVHIMPRDEDMVLDAANVLRLNDKMLYLESASGNRKAAKWLQHKFPEVQVEVCNFYSGVHIDSTIVPLREGLVLVNASRVNADNIPKVFNGWEVIWATDVVAQNFYEYPYASKWIALNMLVVDPSTVICDANQSNLIRMLELYKFTVIPLELRHSRTLGGGFHCVTLDLIRESNKYPY
ncbi:COG1834 N-Dimethylarginine dimethylaminohydrolase [uncultured Caudovirales phage]|uniref:COG1834 N-Dimethylarginine dimethylaminohydrolase n=1 Tax=uncultured Caudovirales phage TaxID=2100421 RepID=A0A6J5LGZ4_9CAUD|nr:COG1834 N-Dimethylarginine dimethylaminohydrolase [uncultured Caudovirales phage]